MKVKENYGLEINLKIMIKLIVLVILNNINLVFKIIHLLIGLIRRDCYLFLGNLKHKKIILIIRIL